MNCEHCKVRPKYTDGKGIHPFCGRACAQAHANGTGHAPQRGNTCSTPGCTKAVFKDSNGAPGKYCGKSHKTWGCYGCIVCRKADKSGKSVFCAACKASAVYNAPAIIEIAKDNETFKSVTQQFEDSWRHPTPRPKVQAVYKIVATQRNMDRYNAYRNSVEARGHFTRKGLSPGNENRRWHGTRRKCYLGDKGCTTLCHNSNCALCGIIKTSFDLALSGKNTGAARFGTGIYTSSTSSKSNDYVSTDSTSPWKAMLLTKVVVGEGYKVYRSNWNKPTLPPGYDSVLAETGGSLNYDEVVVYRNDAARPSYLVMYK